jgi:hypothetical protein
MTECAGHRNRWAVFDVSPLPSRVLELTQATEVIITYYGLNSVEIEFHIGTLVRNKRDYGRMVLHFESLLGAVKASGDYQSIASIYD